MMRKIVAVTLLASASVALPSTPAFAEPPIQDTLQIHNIVQDNGEACGFPVRWEINLAGEHLPRELLIEGGFPAVLAVFCDVLS